MAKIDMTQFHEGQIQAIGYLSLPNKGGMQFEEIADKCGISVRQLHRWRKQPEFKQAVVEQSLENVKEELPNVIKSHYDATQSGNVKAIELFYKLFGLLIDKQEITQEISNKDISNDSLQQELDELKDILS